MNEYQAQEEAPPTPSFFRRVAMVVFQPAELFQALAARPVWFPMLAFASVATGASMAFIPSEAWQGTMGDMPPEATEAMGELGAVCMKIMGVFGTMAGTFGLTLVATAVSYVAFVFIRGDEAKFKQHLSMFSHTAIFTALAAYVYLPFRIRGQEVNLTFSVGTFVPFLPEGGYLTNVLNFMDLFGLWSATVAALGISLLDERRRWGPTAVVAIVLLVVIPALGFGLIPTLFG